MRKQALVALLFCLPLFPAYSQGCSDAGACSIGPMKTLIAADSARESSFLAGVSVGLGEEKVIVTSPFLEANFHLRKDTWLHLRLPFIFNSGNLGSTADMGDIYAGVSHRLWHTQEADLRVLAAGKIPHNRAAKRTDEYPLPMPYQTSLGTYDLILGTSLQYRGWLVSAAYQHVLKNDNENNFLRDYQRENEDYLKYINSRNLDRANDVMLRLERGFLLGHHQAAVGVLPIYHLAEDSYQALNGERVKLKGSDGLTLNLTANFLYALTANSGVRFSAAAPVVTRDVRPDGLTRFAVGIVNFEYRF